MNPELETQIRHLPRRPGVYLFRDENGRLLYVGKAASLRTRVRSHFSDPHPGAKNRLMRARVRQVDSIVVASETEALLLESNMIKNEKPPFNIRLRDDKHYPYIKVTVQEPFPRVLVVRQRQKDGARYFGPYTDVTVMRRTMDVVRRIFTVRSCSYALPDEAPDRPCLDYHLGLCNAPCVGLETREEYGAMIDEILGLLSGDVAPTRRRIEQEMKKAAHARRYERAAELRDAMGGLEVLARSQRIESPGGGDRDVIGFARDGGRGVLTLLRVRDGAVVGQERRFVEDAGDEDDADVLGAAMRHLYLGGGTEGMADLPREVLLGQPARDLDELGRVLEEAAGHAVRFKVPRRGDKARLTQLARENARHLLEEKQVTEGDADQRAGEDLYELKEALGLKALPRFIVCFDISHLQGTHVVGSVACLMNGQVEKDEYRRFGVRGQWGNDDVRSMEEVVGRYVRGRLRDGLVLPELFVIDGGPVQLAAALGAARAGGAGDAAFCALAKREEEVYLPGESTPVRLPRRSRALGLLVRVRDEAHRFAVGYNRRLRTKEALGSELGEVPGIGPARERALLRHLGSVRALRGASVEEIARVPGMSDVLAERVHRHLAGAA